MGLTRLAHGILGSLGIMGFMGIVLGCDAGPRQQPELVEAKRASEPIASGPAVIEPPAVVVEKEGEAVAPPRIDFDPLTASTAKVRIVAVHREGWVACGIIHSTGAIEVEVLEVGEPPPRMVLIISCPIDFGLRPLLEVGTIVDVKLFAKRKSWPTPPVLRKLPPELPRRYVDRMTRVETLVSPTNPASAPAPQSGAAPE